MSNPPVNTNRRWLPLNALRAFEAIGKHLSVTGAANALCVSQSAVSRHLISLEELLGVKLFERKHQRLELTEAGTALLQVVNKSFDRIEQLFTNIIKEGAAPRPAIRLQMPPSFAHHLAIPVLKDFRNAYPEILLDVTTPYGIGMPSSDVDIAIVYSKPEVNDLIADLLWNARLTPLCHPDLIKDTKENNLSQFVSDNEIIHVKFEGQPRYQMWERFIRQAEITDVSVDRGSVFDTAILAAKYAMSGQGIALLDPILFKEELSSGQLVNPFNISLDDGYGYYLLTHPDDLLNDAISLFRSWLINRLGIVRSQPESQPFLITEVA